LTLFPWHLPPLLSFQVHNGTFSRPYVLSDRSPVSFMHQKPEAHHTYPMANAAYHHDIVAYHYLTRSVSVVAEAVA
jgi:hypothetical protein